MIRNDIETRPLTNPVPLGVACFGITVFMFAGYLWGALLPDTAFVATALFVGGLGMLAAAAAAYRRGDTMDTTWMAAYGVFWPAMAFYFWFLAGKAPSAGADLAWIAVAWGIFTAYMFIVSLRARSPLLSAQLLLFFLLFLFMWLDNAFGMTSGNRIAAIAGFLTAIVAAIESFMMASAENVGESAIVNRIHTGSVTGQPMAGAQR